MDWSWLAFAVGVLVGLAAMWIGAAISTAGRSGDEEQEHFR